MEHSCSLQELSIARSEEGNAFILGGEDVKAASGASPLYLANIQCVSTTCPVFASGCVPGSGW